MAVTTPQVGFMARTESKLILPINNDAMFLRFLQTGVGSSFVNNVNDATRSLPSNEDSQAMELLEGCVTWM
jgi:hypothetical protein